MHLALRLSARVLMVYVRARIPMGVSVIPERKKEVKDQAARNYREKFENRTSTVRRP
jgi:hypothetical protein